MISVIMPSMFYPEGVEERINELCNHPLVTEVILIDNTYEGKELEPRNKLIHIQEKMNTGCNRAWNKGVSMAREDKLLIINDDVITDFGIIDKVHDLITEDKGMIGSGVTCWNFPDRTFGGLVPIYSRAARYASLFFIHKKSYTPIPEDLFNWYGDDWLFRESGKQNYDMTDWAMGGQGSQTIDKPHLFFHTEVDTRVWYDKYNK
jgi:GT2 family glycosyltransferase